MLEVFVLRLYVKPKPETQRGRQQRYKAVATWKDLEPVLPQSPKPQAHDDHASTQLVSMRQWLVLGFPHSVQRACRGSWASGPLKA